MTSRLRLGPLQRSALEIYVFDPIFDDEPAFCTVVDGNLVYSEVDVDSICSRLIDASNSADDGLGSPGSHPDLSRALMRIVYRLRS